MMLKKALQLYSIREALEADFSGTLKQVAEMGYEGVELMHGFWGHTFEETEEILKNTGLIPLSVHIKTPFIKDPEIMAAYKKLGVSYMAVQGLSFDDLDVTAKTLEVLGGICKEYGIKLLYHNHRYELECDENGITKLETVYSKTDPETVACEFDLAWVSVCGFDPAEILKRHKGRCPLVHFKDYVGTHGQEDFHTVHLGSGVLPLESAVKAAADIGTEWLVVEQDFPTLGKTALESARLSIDVLENLIND